MDRKELDEMLARQIQRLMLTSANRDSNEHSAEETATLLQMFKESLEQMTAMEGQTMGFVMVRIVKEPDGRMNGVFGLGGGYQTALLMTDFVRTQTNKQLSRMGMCPCPDCKAEAVARLLQEETIEDLAESLMDTFLQRKDH